MYSAAGVLEQKLGAAMSTATMQLAQKSWVRPKYLLFAFVALMVACVLRHNESFLIHSDDPVWEHYQPFKWWLLPHGIAGACALLLGPMQFSDRLRRRFTKLHRVVGRFYVAGVFVAGPLGFYIQFFQERFGQTRSFSMAAAVDALLWMTTAGIASAFILRGNVQLHRQWMTRSFAVALVFLEVRVIIGVTGWENFGPRVVETVVWGCLAFAVVSADIVLSGRTFADLVQPFPNLRQPPCSRALPPQRPGDRAAPARDLSSIRAFAIRRYPAASRFPTPGDVETGVQPWKISRLAELCNRIARRFQGSVHPSTTFASTFAQSRVSVS
jgi:uncharacterized membrane protein